MVDLTTLATAAAVAASMPACNWNAPGANPYRGPVASSVRAAAVRYGFDAATAAELVEKVRLMQTDAVVTITRDGLYSRDGVATNLRDMHHGKATMCTGTVVRNTWRDDQAETAFVYCASSGDCIAIPTICGNVSRVDFIPHVAPAEPAFRAWGGEPPAGPLEPQQQPQLPQPNGLAVPIPRDLPMAPRTHSVPEPSSLLLSLSALVILCVALRTRST